MIPSSTRMVLGSAVLAGLLLASSLPVSATSQTQTAKATIPSSMKPILVATSSTVQNGTYTDTVRKQMKWTTISISKPSKPVVVASEELTTKQQPMKVSEPVKEPIKATQPVIKVVKPTTKVTKPVQVAEQPKQTVSRSDDSSTLVKNALSLQGVPYVFGGTSRSGFDCSGYTQYVFKSSGISLPRTSSEQFNSGSKVSREQLQSGDLVFFTTYAKGPSHVGIYIGGGSFVHASNSGVRITSLSESYYAGRYVGARRMR